jgi:hypothetical protein
MVEALAQVLVPPFQVVQQVVGYQWAFAIQHFPSELMSDNDPPIRLGDRREGFPVDELLGRYEPGIQQITIFRKGIRDVAERLDVRERDLEFVVRLHEWAHALLHLGLPDAERLEVTEDESRWPIHLATATTWCQKTEPLLHERLAQLLTYHGLHGLLAEATAAEAKNALERMAYTFEELTRRSTAEYHIDHLIDVPKLRVVTSIGLLKNATLVGSEAWETVLKW